MEVITVFLIVSALAGLIVQYVIKAVPFYLISEILAGGGVVAVIDEFNGGALDQNSALVLVIVMLAVCIFSALNFVNYYWPARK
jgi:hypothetical protein